METTTKKRSMPSPEVSPMRKEPRTKDSRINNGEPGPSAEYTEVLLIACQPNPVVNPMFDAADPLSRYLPIKVRKVRSSEEW